MTEPQKRMRTSSGGSMSTAPSNATVKREEEVEQGVALQLGGQAGGAAAAADMEAASTQRDDSSKFIVVSVERDRWFHCTACSDPFRLPVYKCDAAGHKVCCTCRGNDNPGASNHCRACNGAAASFTLCSDDYQELVGAPRMACPYKAYGCRRQVSYLLVDEHRRACPDKPCSCFEQSSCCDGGFLGSPRTLHDHLAGPLHSWPTSMVEYGKTHTLSVTERRRLLVSLMCLRSSAAAAAGPHYKVRLWTHAPKDPVTGVEREGVAQSRESPCEIAVGEGMLLPLEPRFLRGESRKIMLLLPH
ncbi:unnamed protein product [Alopecurus aequalis]